MGLATNYMQLSLRSPLVASASPMSRRVSGVRELEDAGAGAVVLFSLFEEQLTLTETELHTFLSAGTSYAETLSLLSDSERLRMGPLDYLEHLQRAKSAVDIPVIASLNGTPHERWTHYAKLLEQAGADAVELNLYYVPTSIDRTGADIEDAYVRTVEAVRSAVKIPVAVKLSPYFTSVANMAARMERAGADALVLFNRFYQPNIDLDRMSVHPEISLSNREAQRLPLRWVAILRDKVRLHLAATSGIHQAEDAIRLLLAGADVTMLCSTLLKHGAEHIKVIERGIRSWMSARDYQSIADFRGLLSQAKCEDPEAFERAQYIKTLEAWEG